MKTIFYSWQSDIKPARNKIKAALELAAKRLGDSLEEADRPQIDSDTKGTYGSEDIIETIFSKINNCTVFVADVTPIAKSGEKLVPNPNVMAEVGYAISAKGKWTRLYVYCTDDPVDESKMPFDIRGKSLHYFSMSDGPSAMADKLAPLLGEMLKAAQAQEVVMQPVESDTLNPIQVSCLRAMGVMKQQRGLMTFRPLGGDLIVHNMGEIDDLALMDRIREESGSEVVANLDDLADRGYVTKSYDHGEHPMYELAKRGYDFLRSI